MLGIKISRWEKYEDKIEEVKQKSYNYTSELGI